MEHSLFIVVDLLGTIAFAVSGATAATERRLDLFGVYAVAFVAACGGGIVRDLCLGAVPPVAIIDWRYLACSAFAATATVFVTRAAGGWLERLKNPVAFFDSLGLGFFAVAGAHKALAQTGRVAPAILLGIVAAVGGGVMRDVLVRRLPVILAKEIYALAALVAAVIQVVAETNAWFPGYAPWLAIGACLVIRFLAVRYAWGLPVVSPVGRP